MVSGVSSWAHAPTVAANSSEAGRALNRRVEMAPVPKAAEVVAFPYVFGTVGAQRDLIGNGPIDGIAQHNDHDTKPALQLGALALAPTEPSWVDGDVTRLDLLLQFDGLVMHGQHYALPLDNLVEVVVAANSTLIGRTNGYPAKPESCKKEAGKRLPETHAAFNKMSADIGSGPTYHRAACAVRGWLANHSVKEARARLAKGGSLP